MRALLPAVAIAASLLVPAAAGAATLRLDGVGPLHLGMSRADALKTGWLAQRGPGGELGGPPIPITYRLSGPKAPDGIRGTVEFRFGHLRAITMTRGATTTTGVRVGATTTTEM